jgi:Uri superfamily endonuclease
MKKEQERELTKKMNQKALLDKFGFSDEDDEKHEVRDKN